MYQEKAGNARELLRYGGIGAHMNKYPAISEDSNGVANACAWNITVVVAEEPRRLESTTAETYGYF